MTATWRWPEAAAALLRRRVVFELTLVNADKAAIGLPEAQRRAAQFAGRAPLLLSREPLFAAKAALFPGAVFVVGRGHRRAAWSTGASTAIPPPRCGGRWRTWRATAAASWLPGDWSRSATAPWPTSRRRCRPRCGALFRELPEESFRCDHFFQ